LVGFYESWERGWIFVAWEKRMGELQRKWVSGGGMEGLDEVRRFNKGINFVKRKDFLK
jgi:hypothetical protein